MNWLGPAGRTGRNVSNAKVARGFDMRWAVRTGQPRWVWCRLMVGRAGRGERLVYGRAC